MTQEENYCLAKIKQAHKPKSAKMPNWASSALRPSQNSILAWEIYGQTKCPYSEHEIIKTLNGLAEKGILHINIANSTVWYELKVSE